MRKTIEPVPNLDLSRAYLEIFEDEKKLNLGFDIAEKIDFESCYAYHSGGGYTHLFLQLKDKNVVIIHFMEICIEVVMNSQNLSLSDFADYYSEFEDSEPISIEEFIESEYYKTITL
jgi:predicted AlkP superfamily phosphohydrolase/phosphomutase